MAEVELPECPVCLQSYNGEYVIPRVLTCGHTCCESCLHHLPTKYPNTVRCPACTQLVKYPPQGPSGLPKNIDLLRLLPESLKPNKKSQNDPTIFQRQQGKCEFLPNMWSDEFYASWKNKILPKEAVVVELGVEEEPIAAGFGNEAVSIVRICALSSGTDDCVIKFNYTALVMRCLKEMRKEMRDELLFLLGVCVKSRRIVRIHGLWGDLEKGSLYLVTERQASLGDFEVGIVDEGNEGLRGFGLMALEICECVTELHLRGVIAGCISPSCLKLDEFAHVCVDLGVLLAIGRPAVNGFILHKGQMGDLLTRFSKTEIFLSPEHLLELTGINPNCRKPSVGRSSDVWSLACILIRLLVGRKFTTELMDCMSKLSKHNGCGNLVEKVNFMLEARIGKFFSPLQQILYQCLNFDSASRPQITDLWSCIRELIIGPQFDSMFKLRRVVYEENKDHCVILGELCSFVSENAGLNDKDELQVTEDLAGDYVELGGQGTSDKNTTEAVCEGSIKFKNVEGHKDCVTGLTVGGGFLFSSSYDKSIKVWSLQDFSHTHTFKGHEHKVMALLYVDGEQPLCISGDSGGGIFVWNISLPLEEEPLRKWYEEADWRFSGIHCMATAGNQFLYTGSGDKSIKAWLLKDSTLSSTMTGHKSVVSSLSVSDGVLYSGSWDGTLRLWNLTDHSLLAVLGEDILGKTSSVLSVIADNKMLIATHDNGSIKVWNDDVFRKCIQVHNGAVFAVSMERKWLFTGGWDKTVNVQELSCNEFEVESKPVGSIPCGSVVTSLLYWQGSLFVGCADRTIKVFMWKLTEG